MGVMLTPIIKKRTVSLDDLRGLTIAVDANNILHQFLALIRSPDGTPLMDSKKRATSHLVGLLLRTSRLIGRFGIFPVFIFDGEPPALKAGEIRRRRAARRKAEKEWKEARRKGDLAKAFSKAVYSGRLTSDMTDDAKRLLELMGVSQIQAPGEAEAQASFMAGKGQVWAVNSQDYDSLLFGAPRLLRYITISGKEFMPRKGESRPLRPELIDSAVLLSHLGLTRDQLVDLSILIGTDYNQGVFGIGPKKALRLIGHFGSIEKMPPHMISGLDSNYQAVRDLFLHPTVSETCSITHAVLDEDGLIHFLCDERDFARDRVENAIETLRSGLSMRRSKRLMEYLS